MMPKNINYYTNEKRTIAYLKQLKKWVAKLENYKGEEKYDEVNMNDFIKDNFPCNKKRDVVLITNYRGLEYDGFNRWRSCDDEHKFLANTPAKVLDCNDFSTWAYHPPGGNWRLVLLCAHESIINEKSEYPQDAYYADPFPPFYSHIFLPHPCGLEEFKKFLGHLSKGPKKLEKILDNYYKKLKK